MPQIQKLVEMGFPEAQVRSTLEATGWDENMALEKLLSSYNPFPATHILILHSLPAKADDQNRITRLYCCLTILFLSLLWFVVDISSHRVKILMSFLQCQANCIWNMGRKWTFRVKYYLKSST